MVTGVCVFDLDGTVVPRVGHRRQGQAAVQDMVDHCEAHGFEIAINTARSKIPGRVQRYLTNLGIYVVDMPEGAVQTGRKTSNAKARGLKEIQETFQVPARNVLLFDDRSRNVKKAQQHGYGGIHVRGGIMSEEDVVRGRGYLNAAQFVATNDERWIRATCAAGGEARVQIIM